MGGRNPRLILRFALYTSVGIALAAASLAIFVLVRERPGHAEDAVKLNSRSSLRSSPTSSFRANFDGAVTHERRRSSTA